MDIDEVLIQAHITHDNKARRVLNTASNLKPNIELSEIESGITIERLESLNVPVYQYAVNNNVLRIALNNNK